MLLLTTGGTIDKDYPRVTSGYAFEFGDAPAVAEIFASLASIGAVEDHVAGIASKVVSICKKDSQEITGEDREKIVAEIRKGNETKVLITHGTDSMVETAEFIFDKMQEEPDKVVVLVGLFLLFGGN